MGKNSYYFDHDYDARNDKKILALRRQLGWDGYGIYFATLECLCEAGGYLERDSLNDVAYGLNVPENEYDAIINSCIEIELLKESDRGIYSDRILRHLDFRAFLSESGKKGGRGNKKPAQTTPALLPDDQSLPDHIRVVSTIEELRSIFFGETFIEECCMKLNAPKNDFTRFVKSWVAQKEITGNFVYNKHRLREFLLKDWGQSKTSKSPQFTPEKRMDKKIGEM